MTRHHKKPLPFFLWHRRLGLLALVLLIILSITGIMLNHTESLELDSHNIDNRLLLDWYGLNPSGEPLSFQAGQHIVTQWDQQLFLNDRLITTTHEPLLGAINNKDVMVILLSNTILLLDDTGSLIEQLQPAFSPFQRLGQFNNLACIEAADKKKYIADQDIISWQLIQIDKIDWSLPTVLNSSQKEQIRRSYRGSGLSLERVILDLHSGRLFNENWGVYLMDASAVIMILLGMSGVWVWWTRKQKIKTKRHYQKHHRSIT